MPVMNFLWAVIILLLTQDVVCYIPYQGQVKLYEDSLPLPPSSSSSSSSTSPLSRPGNIPIHDESISSNEEIGRPIYDPGDELLKTLNAENNDDYIDFMNELELNMNKVNLLKKLEEDIREEQEVVSKSAMLMKLIEDPNIDTLPVVYVEESPSENELDSSYPAGQMEKRSRYYRRYPWKRHSSRNRGTYEPEARYLCVPSKEDVFKLLIGIHENRKGNHHKTVHFCNRKRPAKAIFTNIRFLG